MAAAFWRIASSLAQRLAFSLSLSAKGAQASCAFPLAARNIYRTQLHHGGGDNSQLLKISGDVLPA